MLKDITQSFGLQMCELLPKRLVHVELFEIYAVPVIEIGIDLGEPFDEKVRLDSR